MDHSRIRGACKREFDFQKDPPPDLAIEIEISRSLVDRVGIFAALGIKELWRHNGRKLRFCVLQDDGTYQDQDASQAFPFLTPADLDPFLRLDAATDETSRIRAFRDWLRKRVQGVTGTGIGGMKKRRGRCKHEGSDESFNLSRRSCRASPGPTWLPARSSALPHSSALPSDLDPQSVVFTQKRRTGRP